MITIVYDPHNGYAVPDAEAEGFVKFLKEGQSIIVSTENVVYAARVLVKEEGLEVQFEFEGKIITPNKDGRIADWPEGFCDFFDNWLARLL